MDLYSTLNETIMRIAFILIVFFTLKSLTRPITQQLILIGKSKPKLIEVKRIKTATGFISSIVSIILWLITAIVVLAQFNVDYKTLLAGAGIFGVAFGLAFQSSIKSFMTSFGLFLGGYYEVGDTITIAGVKGVVQEINIKNTILEDEGGIVHFVPNSEIKVITNHSKKT